MSEAKRNIKKLLLWLVIGVGIGVIIALIPPPEGLTAQAMVYLGIFVCMLIVLVAQILPDWIVGISVLAAMVILKIGTFSEVFSQFSSSTTWLVIMVFAFACALGNSGLLKRIALGVLSLFPPTYIGQVLAMMCTGLVVSPLIPSVNAKVNMLIPVATEVTEQVGFKPRSKGALGLFCATYLPAFLCGNGFITGSVYVAMMVAFLPDDIKGMFTWGYWLLATSVWLVVIIIGIFLFCTVYCKPEEKVDLQPGYTKENLKKLGAMTQKEKVALAVLAGCLVMWVTQSMHGIDTGLIGWIGVCILCVYGLMSTQELITRVPWNMIIFIGGLLSASSYMGKVGVSEWLSGILAPVLGPLVDNAFLLVLVLTLFCYLIKFVVIDNNIILAVMMAIFGPLLDSAGISMFCLIFVVYMSANTWVTEYQNVLCLATLKVAGGKYVLYEDFRKSGFAYWIINLVAMLASIFLWKALGLM